MTDIRNWVGRLLCDLGINLLRPTPQYITVLPEDDYLDSMASSECPDVDSYDSYEDFEAARAEWDIANSEKEQAS